MRDYRYRAFITYSHADRQQAEWLQKALEGFTVPRRLVGASTPFGPAPRKLTPIFRDRSDLPAAGDLSAEIDAALKESLFLIVLCSPAVVQSRWAEQEILRFKKYNDEKRVLAAIIGGDPEAALAAEQCFPRALQFHIGADGSAGEQRAEPLAADLRDDHDGKKLGLLKLAAGLLSLPLDELMQRDAHRRNRQMQATAAGLGAVALGMGALALYATDARKQAEQRKSEAEGLIEFMLTDLRAKLEPVGRLDALEVVGAKALDYYGKQPARSLDPDALGRRSRAMLMVGQIEDSRGDLDAALTAYTQAAATTKEQLRRDPSNAQRIFDHAQSVFYVGDIAFRRGDLSAARQGFTDYLHLAEQLVASDPNKGAWQLELAYATSNLGALNYSSGDFSAAIVFFERSTEARRLLHEQSPDDESVALAYAYALSWLALAEVDRGEFARAIADLEKQLGIYRPLLERSAEDFRALDPAAVAEKRLAEAKLAAGDLIGAGEAIERALAISARLLAQDPTNMAWRLYASRTYCTASLIAALQGKKDKELEAADRAMQMAVDVRAADATSIEAQSAYAQAAARQIQASPASSVDDLPSVLRSIGKSDSPGVLESFGEASLALANAKSLDEAAALRATAIQVLEASQQKLGVRGRFLLARLYRAASRSDAAAPIVAELWDLGLRRPDFVQMRENLGSAGLSGR
jgi:tetratricopeptide (TPR) repeat protein